MPDNDRITTESVIRDALEANALLIAENRRMREALQLIKDMGTTYPPAWDRYTEADKIAFPPVYSNSADIARIALAKHGSQS